MRTKQTPQAGSKSHRPVGMAAATFTGRGRGTGDPEEQFVDTPGKDIEDGDLPKVLEDAAQPMEGKPGTSKSKGKTSETVTQATEEAEAPPEETPPDPIPLNHNPAQVKNPPKPQRNPPKTPPRSQVR